MSKNVLQVYQAQPLNVPPAPADLIPVWQTSTGVQKAVQYSNLAITGTTLNSDFPVSGNYTVLTTQRGVMLQVTTGASNLTITFPAAATVGDGFFCFIRKADSGAGLIFTSPTTTPAAFALGTQGNVALVWTDGTNYYYMASPVALDTSGNATLPSVVTLTGTQTLTNKTLTAPVIATISNTGTLTLPTSTDMLVGRATTDTLTNKTLTSPTLTTPALGVATATTINKVTLTAPATGSTLTIADGKTLTSSNTLTLAGTDGTTMTFPATSATVARTDSANTFVGLQTIPTIAITGTSAGAVNLGDNAVTQITSNTTAVTSNTPSGVITSFGSYTLAANAAGAFTVNCSACAATSTVLVGIANYAGTYATNGLPVATVGTIAGGSFVINVFNAHSANALSGVIKFAYIVC